MKLIYSFLFLFIFGSLQAQNAIPNGNFERWTTDSYYMPEDYATMTPFTHLLFDTATVSRSTDRYAGSYSIRLQTQATATDTFPGVFVLGDLLNSTNGLNYTQKPDSIIGYYKCDIKTNDTAQLFTLFTDNNGAFSGFDIAQFTGSQSNWTRFARPIFYLPLATVDTLQLICFSSGVEQGYPGSWLMLDSLHFKGSGITQQVPNGNFELWDKIDYEDPDDWQSANAITAVDNIETVSKTTDKFSGTYALRIETMEFLGDTVGFITNGTFDFENDTIIGGVPFTTAKDTLIGYYKYSPSGIDTAGVRIYFIKNGAYIDSATNYFFSQSAYSKFELPFNSSQSPDSIAIIFVSSLDDQGVGSVLHVDSIFMKSIITSIDKNADFIKDLRLYPNPSTAFIRLDYQALTHAVEIDVIDAIGRVYKNRIVAPGSENLTIHVKDLKSGTYFLRIRSNHETIHRSFIKH